MEEKRRGGTESVDNPLCILLKGKENNSYCKCSALQLGYPAASLPCWARQCLQSGSGAGLG